MGWDCGVAQRRYVQVSALQGFLFSPAKIADVSYDGWTISLYPLMKQDGLVAQYLVWTIGWNYLVGYNPLKVVDLKMRWFGYVSVVVHNSWKSARIAKSFIMRYSRSSTLASFWITSWRPSFRLHIEIPTHMTTSTS